jgi:hypothetical protein
VYVLVEVLNAAACIKDVLLFFLLFAVIRCKSYQFYKMCIFNLKTG